MTRDEFRLYRWRLRLLAEFARQAGDSGVFASEGIAMWEPAATIAPLREFVGAFDRFRAAALEALPILNPGPPPELNQRVRR